jgi:hypothetical protein
MSRLCRLLCPLPGFAMLLLAVGQAHAGPVAPGAPAQEPLADVKNANDATSILHVGDDAHDWQVSFDDLLIPEDAGPSANISVSTGSARINLASPTAPPVIAAPLPPAVVSGLVGLVGVYVYKRRNRLK